ncbi:hypothetical protein FACS1894177_09190 [Bacteroidia bacterium]|nr:hypothetical protein FACS1894177_09190 [Bacteroidia bacterium]
MRFFVKWNIGRSSNVPFVIRKLLCKALHNSFRDAKQFAGLEDSQARSGNKLDFHFNTALTTVNIAKVIQLKDETGREFSFSMRDMKVLFHNSLLLQRFFVMFGNPPNY